jgi:predicted Zn-dependent protease
MFHIRLRKVFALLLLAPVVLSYGVVRSAEAEAQSHGSLARARLPLCSSIAPNNSSHSTTREQDAFLLGTQPASTSASSFLSTLDASFTLRSGEANAQEVLGALVRSFVSATSPLSPIPAVVIEPSNQANAFARGARNQIVLTTAMMRAFNNSSEIAFVVAHELAHISLGHTNAADYAAEYSADRLAVSILKSSGYNPCSGIALLDRLGRHSPRHAKAVSGRVSALESLVGTCSTYVMRPEPGLAPSIG